MCTSRIQEFNSNRLICLQTYMLVFEDLSTKGTVCLSPVWDWVCYFLCNWKSTVKYNSKKPYNFLKALPPDPHQGSDLDLLGSSQHSPEPKLHFTCLTAHGYAFSLSDFSRCLQNVIFAKFLVITLHVLPEIWLPNLR